MKIQKGSVASGKAVIYVRVSSKEQVEEGGSLVTQERLCREHCLRHNLDVVRVFVEQGESAKTANRTQLKKMLEFCSNRKNDISSLIIYKIDRLSRNTDDYSQLRILLRKYQVEIVSITEKFEDSPVGRFIENTMSNVAQFDNDIRTERSVGGMKQTILEGRFVFRQPVGYKKITNVNGQKDIAPSDKAHYIVRIFELAARGYTNLEDIRQQVIKEGFRLDNGSEPSKQHFYDILRNKLYIGIIERFGEEKVGLFEPVIKDKALFWQVQKILRRDGIKSRNMKLDNPDFPLRRFVFSTDYNNKITGGWSTGRSAKYARYNFSGKGGLSMDRDTLHQMFVELMDDYSIPENLLTKLKVILMRKFKCATQDHRKLVEDISTELSKLQKKEGLLIDKNLEGLIGDQLFKTHMEKIQEEIFNCKAKLNSVNEQSYNFEELLKMTEDYLKKPSTLWDSPISIEQKIKLQWFEFPKGITFDGKILRTTETSLLFKLKSYNSEELSTLVSVGGIEPPT